MKIGPWLRTLAYLPPRQVAHRIWRRARGPWLASPLYARLLLAERPVVLPRLFPPSLWPGDGEGGRRILMGTIRLLGRDRPLRETAHWRAAEESPLWRFTLHYFEWLADLEAVGTEEAAARARALVEDWMAAHPRPGGEAWHPYPLSLRVFSWLRHGPFLLAGAPDAFRRAYATSLDRQVRHLVRVPERDLGGNHLLKNLKACLAAAVCMPAREGDLEPALAEFEGQVGAQVLADGCHYERSPSYHLQVLCDLMDIEALLGAAGKAPDWLGHTVREMAGALAFLRHGDGRLALFNDGTEGERAILETVERIAGGAARPPAELSAAGYYRLSAGPTLVLMDAGICCPDELPAHAHADTLSFEFSVGGQRVVVNCGTYAYQDAGWRNRLRGTAAHSTVTVDGLDSAEVHGVFRLGRRPREVAGVRRQDGATSIIEGRHDGYRHLGLVHHRRLAIDSGGRRIDGADRLEAVGRGGGGHRLAARFHLHPGVEARQEGERVSLRLENGGIWIFEAPGHTPRLEESVYAPRFFEMHRTRQIVVETRDPEIDWSFRISG